MPSAMRSLAGALTVASRWTTRRLNGSRSVARTISSLAPMLAANKLLRSTDCSAPRSSTDLIRNSICVTCSNASPIIRSTGCRNFLPWNLNAVLPAHLAPSLSVHQAKYADTYDLT
jgi:hypothetical protein